MLNKSIILNIQNPCDENWNKMQPYEKGKFCMQCSKQVIDFTKLDNKEIVQIIEESKGRICGRMSVSQINKPIEIQSKNKSKLRKILAAIFLIGSASSALASPLTVQTKNMNVLKSESNFKRINLKQIKANRLNDTIKGQVLTEDDDPIPGAPIFVKELNLEIHTNADGFFNINFPSDFKSDFVNVTIGYPGFKSIETRIFKNDSIKKLNFYLKEDEEQWMGEIVIYKIRWWQFWKRF